MSIVVVVGNPKAGSRTAAVGQRIGERAAAAAGLPAGDPVDVIELANVAAQLFDWGAPDVAELVERVKATRLAVVVSPTYKATYTGLLKAFLDRFSTTDLNGVIAIPVLVGAGAAHTLAVEVHLRPLLVEIGASVPTRGLFVLDTELDQLDATIDTWLAQAQPVLARSLNG